MKVYMLKALTRVFAWLTAQLSSAFLSFFLFFFIYFQIQFIPKAIIKKVNDEANYVIVFHSLSFCTDTFYIHAMTFVISIDEWEIWKILRFKPKNRCLNEKWMLILTMSGVPSRGSHSHGQSGLRTPDIVRMMDAL